MNSIHNNGPDDKRLNDELEELDHAYQQLSSEEPPELLDKAILNSAHRAVEKKDRWLDFGWVHGLTTAAVVVLALSIILTQHQPSGLEESGLSPANATTTDRNRSLESASQAVATPAPEALDEFRAKKAMKSEDLPLAKDIIPLSESVESELTAPSTVVLADELAPAEAAEMRLGALKSDKDKMDSEHSRAMTEDAQLQVILLMKRAGNKLWKAELKLFIENHPDYPLPDELKN